MIQGISLIRKQETPTLKKKCMKVFWPGMQSKLETKKEAGNPMSHLWLEGGLLWLWGGDKWELERGTVAAWTSLICGLTMPRESEWQVWTRGCSFQCEKLSLLSWALSTLHVFSWAPLIGPKTNEVAHTGKHTFPILTTEVQSGYGANHALYDSEKVHCSWWTCLLLKTPTVKLLLGSLHNDVILC